MSDDYGRSPAVDGLIDWKIAQMQDERDMELMMGDDAEKAKSAQERFMARRRPLWAEMGLI